MRHPIRLLAIAGIAAVLAVAAAWQPDRTCAAAAGSPTYAPFVTSTPTPGGPTEVPTTSYTPIPWDTPEPPTATSTPKFVIANVGEWTTSNRSNKTIFRTTKMEANPKWLKSRAAKDMKLFEVRVEYHNITSQTTYGSFGMGKFSLFDDTGHRTSHDPKRSTLPISPEYAELAPGSAKEFSVVFEISAKAKPDKMFYTFGSDRTIVVDLMHVMSETKASGRDVGGTPVSRPAKSRATPTPGTR